MGPRRLLAGPTHPSHCKLDSSKWRTLSKGTSVGKKMAPPIGPTEYVRNPSPGGGPCPCYLDGIQVRVAFIMGNGFMSRTGLHTRPPPPLLLILRCPLMFTTLTWSCEQEGHWRKTPRASSLGWGPGPGTAAMWEACMPYWNTCFRITFLLMIPWETAGGGSAIRVSANPMGNPNGILCSWQWLGPATAHT